MISCPIKPLYPYIIHMPLIITSHPIPLKVSSHQNNGPIYKGFTPFSAYTIGIFNVNGGCDYNPIKSQQTSINVSSPSIPMILVIKKASKLFNLI